MGIIKTHVATSQTYLIKNESDVYAHALCEKVHKMATRHKGIVLETKQVQSGEYLIVVYFSNLEAAKVWKSELAKQNIELESIMSSRTYIVMDKDHNDVNATAFCSNAKDLASHYMGSVVAEKKLQEGAYLLVVYFQNEGLMTVWETSMGIN